MKNQIVQFGTGYWECEVKPDWKVIISLGIVIIGSPIYFMFTEMPVIGFVISFLGLLPIIRTGGNTLKDFTPIKKIEEIK